MKSFFPSLIFIGDTHGFIDDFPQQKKVIIKYKPKFVLLEQLQNYSIKTKKRFNEVLLKRTSIKGVDLQSINKLVLLCSQQNIKMIGIDFKNFGFTKRLFEVVSGKFNPSPKDLSELSKLMKFREKNHIKQIKFYSKKTKKPLVVILGSWHFRKSSPIFKEFQNWVALLPCDSKGKLVVSPSKRKIKIRYVKKYDSKY